MFEETRKQIDRKWFVMDMSTRTGWIWRVESRVAWGIWERVAHLNLIF